MSEGYRRILVAVDGSARSRAALDRAVGLAVEHRSVLTLVAAVPRPPAWGAMAYPGVCPAVALCSHDETVREVVQASLASVPASVSVTWQGCARRIRDEVRSRLADAHDLIIVPSGAHDGRLSRWCQSAGVEVVFAA